MSIQCFTGLVIAAGLPISFINVKSPNDWGCFYFKYNEGADSD